MSSCVIQHLKNCSTSLRYQVLQKAKQCHLRPLLCNATVLSTRNYYSFKQNQQQKLLNKASLKSCQQKLVIEKEFSSQEVDEENVDTEPSSKVSSYSLYNRQKRRDTKEAREYMLGLIEEKGKEEWTTEQWSDVQQTLSEMLRIPWDVMSMKVFLETNNVDLGKSLMAYLNSLSEPVNRVTMTHFICLLGVTSSGSEEQEDLMMKFYSEFMSESDLLDVATIEMLVKGLSNTRHYLECLKLFEKCREVQDASAGILANVLLASLKHRNNDVCKQMLTEFDDRLEPTQFSQYFSDIAKTCFDAGYEDGLEIVTNFMEKHSLLIEENHLEEVIAHLKRTQPGLWTAQYSYIHYRGGNCIVCRHKMKANEVKDEDFRALRDSFMNQVIVGSNIFFRSTPEEVAAFSKFIETQGPFDVVIDGLNVINRGMPPPRIERLQKAINYFSTNGQRVLVLGSKVLNQHLPKLKAMKPSPYIYLTSTTRADDVFLLYAALYSGKNTMIVSHDKLRDHRFKLELGLRPVFNKWLQRVQVFKWFFTSGGAFGIKDIRTFSLGPARDPGGWHFPVDDLTAKDPFGKMSVLCLRKKDFMPQIGRPRNETTKYYREKERRQRQQKTSNKEWYES